MSGRPRSPYVVKMRHAVTRRIDGRLLPNAAHTSSAARLEAAYGDSGSSVASVSRDALGPREGSRAPSPYTDPDEPSTNASTPNSAAAASSAAVEATLAFTTPAASSKDAAIDRAPRWQTRVMGLMGLESASGGRSHPPTEQRARGGRVGDVGADEPERRAEARRRRARAKHSRLAF